MPIGREEWTGEHTIGTAAQIRQFDVAVAVIDEFLREDVVRARIVAVLGLVLLVRVVEAINARPLRPGIIVSALGGRLVE